MNGRWPTPLYLVKCTDGHEEEVLTSAEDCACPCPVCGKVTERIWKGTAPTVIQDSCDLWQENGFKEPRHFDSKRERRRALKADGLEECAQHRPPPGSDKSKHTMNHAQIMDAVTLENARILVSRSGSRGNDPAPRPLRIQYVNEVIPRD